MYPLTPWVKRLLVANVLMFIAQGALQPVMDYLVLVPEAVLQRPWTVLTYMFLHADLTHLIFNMIGVFFFGPRVEERLGSRDFLWLYFLAGIGGAVFSFVFAREYPVVGASAAVFGVLLAFAMFWPTERIYIWGVLPVPAWLLAGLLVGGSLWAGISGSQAGVAHFAHLGGLAFGFGYLRGREWRSEAPRREFQRRVQGGPQHKARASSDRAALNRWEAIDLSTLHELNRGEVEVLLKKAKTVGVDALTVPERQFLDRMAATQG